MPKEHSYKAERVIQRLKQKVNRQVLLSLEACVHCGFCTDQCHYVLANPGDVSYAPAYKADKLRLWDRRCETLKRRPGATR